MIGSVEIEEIVTPPRKLGRFSVSLAFLEMWKTAMLPLMAGVVVVDAKTRHDTRTVDYLAFCDAFEEIQEDSKAPKYHAICSRDQSGAISIKWERIQSS